MDVSKLIKELMVQRGAYWKKFGVVPNTVSIGLNTAMEIAGNTDTRILVERDLTLTLLGMKVDLRVDEKVKIGYMEEVVTDDKLE